MIIIEKNFMQVQGLHQSYIYIYIYIALIKTLDLHEKSISIMIFYFFYFFVRTLRIIFNRIFSCAEILKSKHVGRNKISNNKYSINYTKYISFICLPFLHIYFVRFKSFPFSLSIYQSYIYKLT